MDLKGKTVLVTGSSSGIGRATAIAAAREGCEVLVHYRKNKKGAEETLREVEKTSRGEVFQADLSSPIGAEKLFKNIVKVHPKIDLLVNNAGEFKSGELNDYELWLSEFQNILFSVVYVSNEFIRVENQPKFRKIVNISSGYGLFEMTFQDGMQYSAAKAAVNSLTISLAKKYAPNILVNAIAPGYTWTPNWEGTSDKDKKTYEDLARIKRYVQPEEIAAMVMQLFENDAMTGEIIRIDGGLHLWEIL